MNANFLPSRHLSAEISGGLSSLTYPNRLSPIPPGGGGGNCASPLHLFTPLTKIQNPVFERKGLCLCVYVGIQFSLYKILFFFRTTALRGLPFGRRADQWSAGVQPKSRKSRITPFLKFWVYRRLSKEPFFGQPCQFLLPFIPCIFH